MSGAVEIFDDGSGLRLTLVNGVFISCFYGTPTLPRMNLLFERQQTMVAPLARFAAISVVDPRVGFEMPSDARVRAKEIANHWGERMVCSTTLLLGTGFFLSIARSVTAGILMLTQRRTVWHVTTTPTEAVRVTGAECGKHAVPFDATETEAAILQLLAHGSGQPKAG